MKNVKKIIFWTLLLAVIGCSKPIEVIQEKDTNGNLQVEYERRKEDFAKHGWYKRYHDSGQLLEESTYKDNKLEGERKLYYKNGKVEASETYSNGVFEGTFKAYYPTGQLNQEGNYINNEMTGDWTFYHETGELKEVVFFKKNQENGPFKEYYKNGKVKVEGDYEGGNFEVGELKKYDETGKLIAKMNCEVKMIQDTKFSQCITTGQADND